MPPASLKDPVHFFNSRGVSILTAEFQCDKIAELEKENASLKARLRSALTQLKASKSEDAGASAQ